MLLLIQLHYALKKIFKKIFNKTITSILNKIAKKDAVLDIKEIKYIYVITK